MGWVDTQETGKSGSNVPGEPTSPAESERDTLRYVIQMTKLLAAIVAPSTACGAAGAFPWSPTSGRGSAHLGRQRATS